MEFSFNLFHAYEQIIYDHESSVLPPSVTDKLKVWIDAKIQEDRPNKFISSFYSSFVLYNTIGVFL